MRGTLLLLFTATLALTFVSCRKDVEDVPIFVDYGIYGETEMTITLEEKLVDHGFIISNDSTTEYAVLVTNFYSFTDIETVLAPKDDCTEYYYDLDVFTAGYAASFLRNGTAIDSWDGELIEKDEVLAETEQTSTRCTSYYQSNRADGRDSYHRSGARTIANDVRKYVLEND